MTEHADVVKDLHRSLRTKFKSGVPEEEVWEQLLFNKNALETYSNSMYTLATSSWQMNKNNRITWVQNTLSQYYDNNGLEKAVKREYKAKLFKELRDHDIVETDQELQRINSLVHETTVNITFPFGKRLLLDVGSCYNPFKILKEYDSIAIDIAPATEDVSQCDFLNLKITKSTKSSIDSIRSKLINNELQSCVFDIVVFSLLLSYFPSSKQRLKCCINAHSLLRLHGLLVIITPDSSHQNKHTDMMKSWKQALEWIGFTRFKYEKLEHLHCMAYRKSEELEKTLDDCVDLADSFFIPQDFQALEETNSTEKQTECSYDNEIFAGLDI